MLEIVSRLAIALGLGLLVGLQRERTDARLAGFRTFPLVILLGALCGLLAMSFDAWVVAAGLVGLALIIVGGNLPLLRTGSEAPGVTTEVTMLLMFCLGAYLMVGSPGIAIVTCGAVVVLLHLKPQMHSLAERIGDRDFTAIVQFALISLVILPVLPNRTFGPFDVINPFKIWLMVVLIVGISLGGYVAYKLVGERAGVWVSGVLGGLISSTATAVSLSRRSRQTLITPELATFVILIASSVVFLRIAILIATTAPRFLGVAALPLAVAFGVLAFFGWFNLRRTDDGKFHVPEQSNPSELKPALLFGVLYTVVLVAIAAGSRYLGRGGIYLTSAISGLTDMDAITLSVSHLVGRGEIAPSTGWRAIIIASVANLAFKAAIIAFLGERRVFTRVSVAFAATAALTGVLFAFLS